MDTKTQCRQLLAIIDWLYSLSADLFLCGEIIELHEAHDFAECLLRDPQYGYGNDTIAQHWKQITQIIKPAVEARMDRMEHALGEIKKAQSLLGGGGPKTPFEIPSTPLAD